MTGHAIHSLEQAKGIEQHAHEVKMAMYNDTEFIAGIRIGYEQEQQGQLMSWAELRSALGRN